MWDIKHTALCPCALALDLMADLERVSSNQDS